MGIAFVLIIYAIAGSIATVGGGAILSASTWLLLRRSPRRKVLTWRATFFPAVCAAWAATIFIFQATVNVTLLHRDIGLGDGFNIPLPNHYAISYTDVTDHGLVYNPRTQKQWWNPQPQQDDMENVRFLQIFDHYLAGAADTQLSQHFGRPGTPVNQFFAIDTDTNQRTDFTTEQQLRSWASAHHVSLQLEPIANFYTRYRWTWFDGLALSLLLIPPAIAFWRLARSIFDARREARIL